MSRFEYTLIRSNRSTYGIKVTEENKIIVRAPARASVREIESVIEGKSAWIAKVISRNRANALAADSVKNYKSAYVGGRLVPVICDRRNFIDAAGVHVCSLNSFRQAYLNAFGESFSAFFREMQSATGLRAASMGWRSYKSRWGCCDGKGNIVFNFKLLMLPAALQRYVAIHELCHTVHHDHSSAFWAEVGKFLPDWKNLRNELKKYSFIVRLY